MPRDHARINIAIWQDDDWRDLPPEAQHLYFTLWTHPHLNYAGIVDWRPGRIGGMARDWTEAAVSEAADCLEARLFIVRDTDTEECLIRSFVRFDGLMKQPRMAVSFANAYAGTSSRTLRGVIVHEAKKLHEIEPDLGGWGKPQVQELLTKRDIDPRTLDLPDDPFGGGFTHGFGDGFTPSVTPGLPQTRPNVKGSVKGSVSVPPTPAPAPTPLLQESEGPQSQDSKRGTRVPEDFSLTQEMKDWAKEKTPNVDAQDVLAEFVDYWRGVPGQKGVKLDWISTWRNAMRKQQKWAEERGARPASNVRPLRPGQSDGKRMSDFTPEEWQALPVEERARIADRTNRGHLS